MSYFALFCVVVIIWRAYHSFLEVWRGIVFLWQVILPQWGITAPNRDRIWRLTDRIKKAIASAGSTVFRFIVPSTRPDPPNEDEHSCPREHLYTDPPNPARRGQTGHFARASHSIWSLKVRGPASYGNGNEKHFSRVQLRAKDEFIQAYLGYPEDNLTLEQLGNLMRLLDVVFFSSSLVDGPERLVELRYMDYDPQDWDRIGWDERDEYTVGATIGEEEIVGNGTWRLANPVMTIMIAETFGGEPVPKVAQTEALVRQMVHVFIAQHWHGCPLFGQRDEIGEDGRGPTFREILKPINRTISQWPIGPHGFGSRQRYPPPTLKTSAIKLIFWFLDCREAINQYAWLILTGRWMRAARRFRAYLMSLDTRVLALLLFLFLVLITPRKD